MSFSSRKLKNSDTKYTVTELECLSIVHAIKMATLPIQRPETSSNHVPSVIALDNISKGTEGTTSKMDGLDPRLRLYGRVCIWGTNELRG